VTTRHYVLPVDQTKWAIGAEHTTTFTFDYDEGRDRLLSLYEKGKEKQWNTNTRIDWSIDVDPESPDNYPEYYIPIYGSPIWDRMTEKERGNYRQLAAAWTNSQFLHGEQGALVCTAKIVQTVPDVDCKFYAATQVMDEARHMETYSRYLREKIEMAFPINDYLKTLLSDVVADDRWDMTCLGMQIMIEGLALAAFAMIRDFSDEPLAKAINTYVMQDEARHVAFGRLALRDYYPQLSDAERGEREEFVVEACYLMRDRFRAQEVWQHLGFDVERCMEYVENSEMMREFQRMLFSRIVPTVKDIGLWGPKIRKAYEDMGVIQFSEVDVDALQAQDEEIARKLDQSKGLSEEAEAATAIAGIDQARALEVQQTIEAGRPD